MGDISKIGYSPDKRSNRFDKAKALFVIAVVIAMMAGILVPTASAQDQTSWYVNDNPSLFGPSQYWWAGDAGKGYGANNFRYTYGIAGESSPENWARWSMGTRVGRQEIQVYVPNARATATVLYRIDIGGTEYTKRIVQRNAYGWTRLGTYDVDGASVTITLRDNDAFQHWNRDGYSASSIGVDAAAMRCVSRCSTGPSPTEQPQISARSVSISLGADRADCGDQSKPCRWLSGSYLGFASGRYSAQCYSSTSRGSLGTRFASFNAETSSGSDSTLCWFNGTPGRYLTAVVDGVRSNTIQFAGTAPAQRVQAPSAPRNLGVSADEDSVDVSWSAPSSDGGAAVSGYRVDLYRGSARVDRKSLSGSARSARFGNLAAGTSYQVRVSAHNSAGRSPAATADVRTSPAPTPTPRPTPAPTPQPVVSPTPQSVPEDKNTIFVHFCSEVSGAYSSSDLQSEVDKLNKSIVDYFKQQSGGQAKISFARGDIHQSEAAADPARTIEEMKNTHPCRLLAEELAWSEDQQILMLVDRPPSSRVWGFASGSGYLGREKNHLGAYTWGFSVVPTRQVFTSTGRLSGQWEATVAHDLAHSLFGLLHTNDTILNGKTFGGNAPEIRGSLMNNTFRGVASLNDVRIFCINRLHASWQCEAGKPDPFLSDAEIRQGSGAARQPKSPPSVPRGVSAVAHGERQIRAYWSAPSNPGSSSIRHYRVSISRPAIGSIAAWSHTRTVTGTSYTSGNLRRGVTYTVTVTAVDQDGRASGPAQATATTNVRHASPPSVPRGVSAVAHGERQIRAYWSAPSNPGSSSIRHYRVSISRPAIGSIAAWSHTRTVTGTSYTSGNLRRGVTYTVTVTAINEEGLSSSAVQTTGTTNVAFS